MSEDDDIDDNADDAWTIEIEQRLAEYRAARVRTILWEKVRAYLHRPDK